MEKIADIDVLGDEATQLRVTRWSQTTLAVGVLVAAVTALLTGMDGGALMTAPWWIAVVVASIVALPVHELVHGAAFALLCPGCKVSFGAKDAFLYTRTDGALTTRGRMVAVLAAPAVVVTAALAAAESGSIDARELDVSAERILRAKERWIHPAEPESAGRAEDFAAAARMARAAGIDIVSVTWGFRDRAELVAAGAVHIVDRPAQLLELL